MKRALISVLRLVMLVGVLVLLPFISKGPKAQMVSQCVTFSTENESCPSCCSSPATQLPNNILDVSQTTGTQSLQNTSYSCGTAIKGCPVGCSGEYPQAFSDSSCCIAEGVACATNEPCCPGTACVNGVCTGETGIGTGPDPEPPCDIRSGPDQQPGPCSPVILDLSGEGFFLTSAANGVKFDIAGTGNPVQMGWTAPGADNAFLALPGADGLVDTGKQLFGNFTSQPASNNPNGFAALAVYDLPANGGNGDGIIDSRDAIYSSLRLWIDANHDGISQTEELHTLSSLGVVSISLNYTLSRRVDQYGNVFRYKAAVDPNEPDPSHVGRTAYDVFFVTAASSGTQ
jgi:hypothetical protein